MSWPHLAAPWRSLAVTAMVGLGTTGPLSAQQPSARESQPTADTDEDAQPDSLPPLPPGLTLDLIRQGDELYRGKGGCAGCHGANATGVPDEGSALTAGLHFIPMEWKSIDSLITAGIPEEVTRTSIAMPERGEMSDLTPEEIRSVSAYVWAISQVRGEPWPGGHASHPEVGMGHHAGGIAGMDGGHGQGMMGMEGPLGIPMIREGGSGTSWLPDVAPMYMRHMNAGNWTLMFHGNAFLQYITEEGDRGDDQLASINWVMGMARRKLGGGDLQLRLMMSAEPFTVGKCGYPDLLATGEFCNGNPLHDRQHPHDLFMDLSAGYERAISKSLGVQVYGGPVGEPALGPVAYPHRVSSLANPMAPISHHWLDATHISFGVLTAGIFGRHWKLEGSVFNGREPDEDRYDIDLDALDSYSARLWLLPSERWTFQASVGRLNEVEPAMNGQPAENVTRPTASLTYHRPLTEQGVWATTFAFGSNIEGDQTTNAYLVESSLDLQERNVLYGRAELVEKTAKDLALEGSLAADPERVFRVGALAIGYVRELGAIGGFVPGIGGRVSLNFVPAGLEPVYGGRQSVGLAVYLNLRPAPMEMGGMKDGGMKNGRMAPGGGQTEQQPSDAPERNPPHQDGH